FTYPARAVQRSRPTARRRRARTPPARRILTLVNTFPPALAVIPTYNEAATLHRLIETFERDAPWIDVLIVDDASPDGTGALADRMAATRPWLHVLHRPGKDGLGNAYRAGFEWALEHGYPAIAQLDADLSHPPSILPEMLAALEVASTRSQGYVFQVETTQRAHRAGLRIVEVPFTFRERTAGHSKMRASIALEGVRMVARLRRDGWKPQRVASAVRTGA